MAQESINNLTNEIFESMRYCTYCRMMTYPLAISWPRDYIYSPGLDQIDNACSQCQNIFYKARAVASGIHISG